MPSSDSSLPRLLTAAALPLAATAAVAVFGARQVDGSGRAETFFLALLLGVVLAAVATLGSGDGREAGIAALLAVTLTWSVGFGPHRGAAVSLVLVAALAVAALRRWTSSEGLGPGLTVPAALAIQVLTRCDLLLAPLWAPRPLVSLLVLPTLSGLALSVLARREDRRAVAVAGLAAAVLYPGWNVASALGLLALAAGSVAGDEGVAQRWRVAAGLGLVLPIVVQPASGVVFALGGAALAVGERRVARGIVAAAAVATIAVWRPDLVTAGRAVLLVPAGAVAVVVGRDRGRAILGLLLAVAGSGTGSGAAGLVAGVTLLALAVDPGSALAAAQLAWSGVVLAAGTLLAAYPWRRTDPLTSLVELLGATPRTLVVAALGVFAAAAAVGLVARERPRVARGAASAVGLAVAAALLLGARPPLAVPLSYPTVLLAPGQSWIRPVPEGARVGQVAVDSNLIQGVDLPTGRTVARVSLLDAAGKTVASWKLRVGKDTAEWAAGRRDIADRPGFRSPPPHLVQIAAEGPFFSERFRSRFATGASSEAASRVRIQVDKSLPADLRLVVYRVELR